MEVRLELLPGIEAIDLALYMPEKEILIIGDMHIGYEEALNRQGILMPRFHISRLIERLQAIFDQVKVRLIVVNGDIKHEFGQISEQEWRDTLKVYDFLSKKAEIVMLKGNHDTILGPIAEKRKVVLRDHFSTGPVYICHGHKVPNDKDFIEAKTLVVGHLHPAISLVSGSRSETYKAFLVGRYKGKNLVCHPSFNMVTTGLDLAREKHDNPFIDDDAKVYIVSDRIYDFGRLGGLK